MHDAWRREGGSLHAYALSVPMVYAYSWALIAYAYEPKPWVNRILFEQRRCQRVSSFFALVFVDERCSEH
jgi:hypothetical protein